MATIQVQNPILSPQARARLGQEIERERPNNRSFVVWKRKSCTCHNALHGDITALAEPQRSVSVLVQPLPVPLGQQLLVVVREVVHVKVLHCVVLQQSICY